MAHSYGALVCSRGKTPEQLIDDLVAAARAVAGSLSVGGVQPHDEWRSVTLTSNLPDGSNAEQSLQVNVGDDVVDAFLEIAQSSLGPDAVEGRDAMVYGTLSGVVDWHVVNEIVSFATRSLSGIPWDQASGFTLPAE